MPLAHACTAGYRSVEWLALESPLIVIGDVAGSDAAPPLRGRGEGLEGVPAIVTVRVRQILKGIYTEDFIRIRTGPVYS